MRYLFSEAQLEFIINAMSMSQEEINNIVNLTIGDIALQGAFKDLYVYLFSPNMRVWKNTLYITAPNISISNNKLIIS